MRGPCQVAAQGEGFLYHHFHGHGAAHSCTLHPAFYNLIIKVPFFNYVLGQPVLSECARLGRHIP